MYQGEIFKKGDQYFVNLLNSKLAQKTYPLSKIQSLKIIDSQESKIVEVELVPNQEELDEQVEYTARLIDFYSSEKTKLDETNKPFQEKRT